MVRLPSLYVIPAVCLCVLISACGASDDQLIKFGESQTFERVSTIEIEEDDERFIGALTSMNVEVDPLRLYIADRTMHRIAVLDSSGAIVQLIGQEGEGPGELQSPMRAILWNDSLVVENSRGELNIFMRDGGFARRANLPSGIRSRGRWTLNSFQNDLYLAISALNPQQEGLIATSDTPVAAKLDHDFSVIKTFGTFPALYQKDEYSPMLSTLDINSGGRAAIGFELVEDVFVYDVTQPDKPVVDTVKFAHPNFMHPPEPLPIDMPMQRRMQLAPQISRVVDTYILNSDVVVQTFGNGTEEYYADRTTPQEEFHMYAALGKIGSDESVYLELPGRILARDGNDRLYIELNHRPDERKIGVYEVNWP